MVWEWENDHGSWTPYDMDVGITIQHAFEKQRPWIDLSPIGFGYVIDFAPPTSARQFARVQSGQ